MRGSRRMGRIRRGRWRRRRRIDLGCLGASPCLRRAFTYLEERGLGGEEERRRGGEGPDVLGIEGGLEQFLAASSRRPSTWGRGGG